MSCYVLKDITLTLKKIVSCLQVVILQVSSHKIRQLNVCQRALVDHSLILILIIALLFVLMVGMVKMEYVFNSVKFLEILYPIYLRCVCQDAPTLLICKIIYVCQNVRPYMQMMLKESA